MSPAGEEQPLCPCEPVTDVHGHAGSKGGTGKWTAEDTVVKTT